MTEQQADQPMTNHDRMNYWWRRATQADAELDSWMTRAYEAEGKLWKAEARIKAARDVHTTWHEELSGQIICAECDYAWPCRTIRALDGEDGTAPREN